MTSTAAFKLSFDVLGLIFHQYAKTATLLHPLETLLLVCRSWNDAALGHRSLWTSLRIRIGHFNSSRVWKTRLPRRLERCGPILLLQIDIRNMLVAVPSSRKVTDIDCDPNFYRSFKCGDDSQLFGDCGCHSKSYDLIDDLLVMLAGQDGDLCQRWESLTIDLRATYMRREGYSKLGGILCHPMPKLTSLAIYGLRLEYLEEGRVFPHTPDLHSLILLDFFHARLSSRPSIHSLVVVADAWNGTPLLRDLQTLKELVVDGGSFLPNKMENLRRLEVKGAIFWLDTSKVVFPSLTHLCIHEYSGKWLEVLVRDGVFDSPRLVSFELYLGRLDYSDSNLNEATLALLVKATGLNSICGDEAGISIVLKLLWEMEKGLRMIDGTGTGRKGLLAGRMISISCGNNNEELHGHQTCVQLCGVAESLNVTLPDVGRDYL